MVDQHARRELPLRDGQGGEHRAAVGRHEGVPRRRRAHDLLHIAIFPGITDAPAIIEAAKDQCNLVWLENLNLRGDYKARILDYIDKKHPELVGLYEGIYKAGDHGYWSELDSRMREFCEDEGLEYVRDDDSMRRPFDAPPVVVNYFFHEQIIPSAKKEATREV